MSKVTIEDAKSFMVGPNFQLDDVDPAATPGVSDVDDAFNAYDDELSELHKLLFANGRAGNEDAGSVLLVLQGMDTSGKGGLVRHVVGQTMDPQGVRIQAFGKPTEEEAEHDFLWRFYPHLPEPGEVSVFDRSHYEDVLVQRVKQMAPPEEIERRYGAIVDFEKEAAARGTKIIKVMPHISRDFQAENLKDRIERADKHWKYNPGDIDDRRLWSQYMAAYQIAMTRTSTDEAPWYCIPSDNKKYCRAVVKTLLVDALASLDLTWPEATFDKDEELKRLAES
ncbi:PPK2 family polyphosphate--nucleotide phosphotransferase [Corynebacterium hadale]|uniref:PPK2 family polyphosphate--nucleotide phosphotransferase n=1 Tax=Corynebacterium hadale TaxID=2026255 RepID=A0A269PE52_9CORY|nr:PPK2 family polyphosphate kinase [Corynebacterium hadale]MCG7253237.1 PPK2 family polyphosphate--nucleotide phosphotransferase [Corynebacterium hadale]MCG7255534.1 PPK2 family polyphosphate--nucleotide phosphotransferase [Corynebacterium hadale]MCG7264375.1 PPK2 family polyphosphate--nucleotide phosphotransferase [Corynebacterium hadale]PAJ70195.1 PPK2 family polyphosphate--nucleotide phosphotransferase [Corynebacterium hadale]PAT05444.1 PPK2 family polyphosphate--nucleotide phosphotransfer